jgi:NTE family protein
MNRFFAAIAESHPKKPAHIVCIPSAKLWQLYSRRLLVYFLLCVSVIQLAGRRFEGGRSPPQTSTLLQLSSCQEPCLRRKKNAMQARGYWSAARAIDGQDQEHRRVGLVLGGGGGKGGAHLGAIMVIESLGLPIDLIVGSSIGGALGGLYAAGYSIDEIAQAFGGATMWRLFERDPTGMGLLGLRRVRTILEAMLGRSRFEDLATPCAVVTTDLVSGREVVLDSGPLVEALLATMAFPGIFPPVQRDGMLLADGGTVNNLPVDVAYARGADKVIAVDLGAICENFGPEPAGRGALGWLNLLPSQPMTFANRGLAVLMAHLTRYRLAENPPDLLLCPEVEHISTLDLSRINDPASRTAGEEVARAALSDLLTLREWRLGDSRSIAAIHGLGQQAPHLLPVR